MIITDRSLSPLRLTLDICNMQDKLTKYTLLTAQRDIYMKIIHRRDDDFSSPGM